MAVNTLKGKCGTHHIDIEAFCPICLAFRCTACQDTHNNILHNETLSKCMLIIQDRITHCPQQQELDSAIENLTKKFNESIYSLKAEFNNLIEFISLYIDHSIVNDKTLLDFGLNEKSIKFLVKNGITQESKLEKPSTDPQLKQILTNATAAIDGISKISINFQNATKSTYTKKPNVIHFLANKQVIVANLGGNSKYAIELDKPFHLKTESISVGDQIFIIGGINATTKDSVNTTLEIDISNQMVKAMERMPMLIKKHYHTLCESYDIIYSIGGINGVHIPDVEKFSILYNKWESLPNLINSRGSAAAFIFNRIHVYVAGGYNESTGNVNLVERLFLPNPLNWEAIQIAEAYAFPLRNSVHAIQINEREAIVFGSYSRSKESYKMIITDQSVQCMKCNLMMVGGRFRGTSAPIFDGVHVFGVDNKDNIHIFNIADGKWSILKSAK
jgi:hypothetical protein